MHPSNARWSINRQICRSRNKNQLKLWAFWFVRAKSFRSLKSRHDAAKNGFIRQSLMKNASFLPSNDKFRSKRQSITIEVKFVWAENNAKSTFVQEGRTNLLSAMKIDINRKFPVKWACWVGTWFYYADNVKVSKICTLCVDLEK